MMSMKKNREIPMSHTVTTNDDTGLDTNHDIIGKHFLWLLCGRPGSGKSWLLTELLLNKELLYKKFQHVFIYTPTPLEGIRMDLNLNWFTEFTPESLESCIDWADKENSQRVLVILDDVIGTLKNMQNSEKLMNLIFNRRHKLKNGVISFIITTQKYILCPPRIRSCLTGILFFKPMAKDLIHIREEHIFDWKTYYPMLFEQHFNKGEHNFIYVKTDIPAKICLNFEIDL